jgi:hypothetical protein
MINWKNCFHHYHVRSQTLCHSHPERWFVLGPKGHNSYGFIVKTSRTPTVVNCASISPSFDLLSRGFPPKVVGGNAALLPLGWHTREIDDAHKCGGANQIILVGSLPLPRVHPKSHDAHKCGGANQIILVGSLPLPRVHPKSHDAHKCGSEQCCDDCCNCCSSDDWKPLLLWCRHYNRSRCHRLRPRFRCTALLWTHGIAKKSVLVLLWTAHMSEQCLPNTNTHTQAAQPSTAQRTTTHNMVLDGTACTATSLPVVLVK